MSGAMFWSAILIGLVLLAFIAVVQVKKRLVKTDETMSKGFTLADLRALHRSGKMSDQEFEKAKEAVIAGARRAAERTPEQQERPAKLPPG